MVRSSILIAALASVAGVAAISCDLNNKCPEDTPCCSQYGECGVGAYCLGGCDPRSSTSLDSCVPEPVCESKTYTFTNNDRIMDKTEYLGDASQTDWVMDGQAVIYEDTVLLTMAPNTVGTVLATTTYMWYGNMQARFKTSRGQGVVTACILLSDVKDEIDYEFVGVNLTTAQSNYYHQGITDYNNMAPIALSDTFDNYHTYEVDWTPDTITWLVDGQVGRVKKRTDTWNATSNQWAYPQTPARVQISLWPGGLASNGEGTIAWAGGLIDWSTNNIDIKTNGYYYAQFESVTVSCYNASSPPGTNLHTSYTYDSYAGTNDTVVDGTKTTVLSSLLGTGTNMTAALNSGAASSSVATVPGLSGTGPGTDGHAGNETDSTSTESGSAASGTDSGSAATGTGFQQGSGSTGSKSAAGSLKDAKGRSGLGGSVFAGIVAVAVLMYL